MLKRSLAGILWFFAAWSAWTLVAYALGLPGTAGVVIGVAVAGLVAVDPGRRIWDRHAVATAPNAEVATAPHAEPEPDFA